MLPTVRSASAMLCRLGMVCDVLISSFYEMQGIRNSYRDACSKMGAVMDKSLVMRFVELEAVMLAPIVPHWSDNIWRFMLNKKTSLWNNSWPDM